MHTALIIVLAVVVWVLCGLLNVKIWKIDNDFEAGIAVMFSPAFMIFDVMVGAGWLVMKVVSFFGDLTRKITRT